jgi:hypothetical protein
MARRGGRGEGKGKGEGDGKGEGGGGKVCPQGEAGDLELTTVVFSWKYNGCPRKGFICFYLQDSSASPRIKTKDFSNVENVKFRFVMTLIVADIPASSYRHCFAKQ